MQLEPDNVERVEIVVAGYMARCDPELVGRAVLKGLLEGVTAQAVNLVNAHLVARERGLESRCTPIQEPASGYTNLITVTTQAGTGSKILAGTVFDGVPRIVRLRDLHIEFIPEGHILVLSYEDRPGVVGKIGSILGRHNVNIASMHVGRRTKPGPGHRGAAARRERARRGDGGGEQEPWRLTSRASSGYERPRGPCGGTPRRACS